MFKKIYIFFFFLFLLNVFSLSWGSPPVPGKKGYQGPQEPVQISIPTSNKFAPQFVSPATDDTVQIGTNTIIVIRVEFQNGGSGYTGEPSGNMTTTFDDCENFFTRIKNYYQEVSYGLLNLEIDISSNVYLLPETMDYYGTNEEQTEYSPYVDLIQHSLTASDGDIDFSQYDSVMIYHAGWGEESDGLGDSPNDIWSCFVSLYSGNFQASEKNFPNGIIVAERENQDGASSDALGIICHEYGHQLGLPDLYDAEKGDSVIGPYCLMDSGCWLGSPRASQPSHFCSWSKIYLNWLTPEIVEDDIPSFSIDKYAGPISSVPKVYKIPVGISDYPDLEYFLISYRKKIGYDSFLPSQGLVVFHIDELVGEVENNNVNYKSYPHPMVALVSARGGIQAGVPWTSVENIITTPQTDAYNGEPSGITIYNISGESAEMMTAGITYLQVSRTLEIVSVKNYPNPYKSTTHNKIIFDFASERPAKTKELFIYNIAGELVAQIPSEEIELLTSKIDDLYFPYQASWDGRNQLGEKVASGIYVYLIQLDGTINKTGKFAIIK